MMNKDKYNWTKEDFASDLLLHICDDEEYEDDYENRKQLVIASVFGWDEVDQHTFDEAVGVTMCEEIGCPHIEYLLGLGFFDRLSAIDEQRLAELNFNRETLEFTCLRCKQVHQL